MTDLEYLDSAEALLRSVEAQCDRLGESAGADIDTQRAGAMVTLAFAGGGQIVVNLQKPLHEVWLATRSGGHHYRLTGGAWRDTRTGEDFFERLSQGAAELAGVPLRFGAAGVER